MALDGSYIYIYVIMYVYIYIYTLKSPFIIIFPVFAYTVGESHFLVYKLYLIKLSSIIRPFNVGENHFLICNCRPCGTTFFLPTPWSTARFFPFGPPGGTKKRAKPAKTGGVSWRRRGTYSSRCHDSMGLAPGMRFQERTLFNCWKTQTGYDGESTV